MKNHTIAILLALPLLAAAQTAPNADCLQLAADIARYESGADMAPIRAFEELVRQSSKKPDLRKDLEAALIKILSAEATFEAKRFACQNLAFLGSEASLPALAKLLEMDDTVGIACLALGSYPSGKANQVLRAALATSKGISAAQIVNTLGDRRDAEAVGALIQLARGPDPLVVEPAIIALAKIGSAEARAAVVSLCNEAPANLAATLNDASLRTAAQLAAAGDRDAAVKAYEDHCKASQPPHIRRAAFAALLRLDRDGGERRILAALHNGDALLKPAAIAGIVKLDVPGASEKFSAELVGLEPDIQILLIGALAARGDEGARRGIAAQIENANENVALAAIRSLGSMGDASSVPALARVVAGPTKSERSLAALASLQQLRGAKANEAILAATEAAPAEGRASMIGVIASRQMKEAVPYLMEQASNADPKIASAALHGLGKLAGPDQLPELVDMIVKLENPALQSDVSAAMVQIARKIENPEKRSEAVLAAYRKTGTVSVKCAMLRALAQTAGAEALDSALAAMGDQDKELKEAATRAVANWSDPEAAPRLLAQARSTDEPTAKVLLLRGAVRLLARSEKRPAKDVLSNYAEALQIATRTEEKRMVIAGLSSYPVAGALGFLTPLLEDPDLRAEAAPAIVRIVKTRPDIDPGLAKSLLPKATAAMAAPAGQAREAVNKP